MENPSNQSKHLSNTQVTTYKISLKWLYICIKFHDTIEKQQ